MKRTLFSLAVFCTLLAASYAAEKDWRALPIIKDGKVHPDWAHTGWGSFAVDDGALRTDCDPRGLGLLVYKKERLGNCQIRVVFKTKDERANAGVYVRIDDGILKEISMRGPTFERDASGKISDESMTKAKALAEREKGPWYAVHRGFEVQIAGGGDSWHRTGAIYSLAESKVESNKPGEWQTMIITLDGNRILVDLDGQRTTTFDSAASDLPARKQWHEPKREPKRPQSGYIGLQNHDPGDVVWFKEISVRPLPESKGR
jgi:hypothetical protein